MGKHNTTDDNFNDLTEKVDRKKKKTREPVVKSDEEIYVESLSKKERKEYEKRKRNLRRSQWVAEYWIIIVLSVALLVVATVLVIINSVRSVGVDEIVKRLSEVANKFSRY